MHCNVPLYCSLGTAAQEGERYNVKRLEGKERGRGGQGCNLMKGDRRVVKEESVRGKKWVVNKWGELNGVWREGKEREEEG